jgi:maltose/moltooligosaccharide transporter
MSCAMGWRRGSGFRPDVVAGRGAPVWTLGLGAFGLAFSLTTTAAYLPRLLKGFTDSTSLIGLVLGAEGAFALTLPLVIGPWSDTFHTPLGRRRPFMLAAIGPLGFCLALVAFMPSLWTMALLVFAFFFAYYVYEPPYRGLYPDLLPESVYGRAQGVQHLLRGLALGAALIGGAGLFHLWKAAPFLVSALVVVGACSVPIVFLREVGGEARVFEGVGTYLRHSWRVFSANGDVRRFLIANAAWEGTFAGARSFVVLYLAVGLGQKSVGVSTSVLATVAGGYVVAALVAGRLGDRFGLARVIWLSSIVYGLGLLAGGLVRSWHYWYLVVVFLVAITAGAVMTLAWGLLFKLMPASDRGAISGLATTTKGFGLLIGTPLAGLAVDLLAPHLRSTHGYQALWPLLSVPILAAIPLVMSLERVESDADRAPGAHEAETPHLAV